MNKYIVLREAKPNDVSVKYVLVDGQLGEGCEDLSQALSIHLKDMTGSFIVKLIKISDIDVREK